MGATEYGLAGCGSCKNISVDIDEALDGSHYEVSIEISSEFLPAHLRLRFESLRAIASVLQFMSDHIGIDGFYELEVSMKEGVTLTIVKDEEFNDRFFLKLFGDGFFVQQTLGGLSAASFIKALQPALSEARTKP